MSTDVEYRLYGEFGDRYDLHTPPHHYEHDHAFVLARVRDLGGRGRLLDLGCGTGVLLEKAVAAGLEPLGFEPAPKMLALARQRVGDERVQLARMQTLDANEAFECVVSLSWSLNYCHDVDELRDVLGRCYRALRSGGELIVQVAHAPHAPARAPAFNVDREPGPGGPDDILLRYRFWAADPCTMAAEYQFECVSSGEQFAETHYLQVADARLIAKTMAEVGFDAIELLENWRGQPFDRTFNPFVISRRPL